MESITFGLLAMLLAPLPLAHEGNQPFPMTAYVLIRDESVNLPQRTRVNFLGAGVSCADNAGTGTTDCTISGGAGGGAPDNATYWVGAADATLTAEINLGALGTGLVLNTGGTPSAYGGTSCTNQFARSLNASGVATCNAVSLTADISGDLPYANLTASGAASRLLGRGDSGAGDWQEITLGTNLSITGTTINAAGGGGAPTDAGYWVDQANATLSAERNLGALTTGLVLNTVTASVGVPSAFAGTSCTDQFVRSLNASGVATCNTVADADVVNTITLDNLTQITTRAIADTTGTLAVGRGGTGLTATADDSVLVGDGAAANTARAIPNCGESGTLNYDTATNTFSCLTDGGGGGGANVVSASINFGTALSHIQTVTVSATWVTSGSLIVCAPQATTADGQTIENYFVSQFSPTVSNLVVGTSFDVTVFNPVSSAGIFRFSCTGV